MKTPFNYANHHCQKSRVHGVVGVRVFPDTLFPTNQSLDSGFVAFDGDKKHGIIALKLNLYKLAALG
jgi:hypothetical protein